LTAGQIDVTQLTDQVDGYNIANQVSVKDALALLMPAYYFDAAEDQGKIKFVKRGGGLAVVIPDNDLGAHPSDEEGSDLYETTRVMDEELPSTLSVNYVLAATKYSPASKYARRLVGYSGDEQRLEFAMVFSDEKALQIAHVNLHDQWVSRLSRKLTLGMKYAYLMPTDLIGVSGYVWRITQMTQKGAYFEVALRARRQRHLHANDHRGGNTASGRSGEPAVPDADGADVNINMLRDADNDPGFYAAACAADPAAVSWPGCSVYASVDGGTTYTALFNIASESTMGRTTDALGNFFGGNIPDELNHVNVQLSNGTLSSTNNTGLLAGVNMAVIGDEILFFRDATLQGDGSYTLRGFLRGRRGSEYAMSGHSSSERFVLVDATKFVRVPQSTADIGIAKKYKPVTLGMTLATASAYDFTNEGTGLKPYAPVQLGGGRDASNNATLNWVRRGRMSGEWRDGVDVPLGETSPKRTRWKSTAPARTRRSCAPSPASRRRPLRTAPQTKQLISARRNRPSTSACTCSAPWSAGDTRQMAASRR
jgi:hypothetical protein